jgi:S-adenosylmethionine hydrolase
LTFDLLPDAMGGEGSVVTVIALLTDFGTADGYVGIMHGVILRINPAATVVDVCRARG